MNGCKLSKFGHYVPEHVVTNYDFEKIMDTSHDWIVSRTGIKERRYEATSLTHMAIESAKMTMEGVDPTSIDLVICATYTPDTFIPTTAGNVAMALGIHAPAFDLNAACSGFVYGLHTAIGFIKSQLHKKILFIGADMNSRMLDYTDRTTAILFGDGAASCIVEASETDHYIGSKLYGKHDTNASLVLDSHLDSVSPFLPREKNEKHFTMKGQDVFKFAVSSVRKVMEEVMALTQIDVVAFHQANQRIIEKIIDDCHLESICVPVNVDRVGNTSSASLGIVLSELEIEGKLKPGMKVLTVGFGGGLSYGWVAFSI